MLAQRSAAPTPLLKRRPRIAPTCSPGSVHPVWRPDANGWCHVACAPAADERADLAKVAVARHQVHLRQAEEPQLACTCACMRAAAWDVRDFAKSATGAQPSFASSAPGWGCALLPRCLVARALGWRQPVLMPRHMRRSIPSTQAAHTNGRTRRLTGGEGHVLRGPCVVLPPGALVTQLEDVLRPRVPDQHLHTRSHRRHRSRGPFHPCFFSGAQASCQAKRSDTALRGR